MHVSFQKLVGRKEKDPATFAFTLEPRAFLVLVKNATVNINTKDASLLQPTAVDTPSANLFCQLNLETPPPGNPLPDDDNTLIKEVPAVFSVPNYEIDVYEKAPDGTITWKNGFSEMNVRIALVVFVAVKQNGAFCGYGLPGYWNPGSKAPTTYWIWLLKMNILTAFSFKPRVLRSQTRWPLLYKNLNGPA